MSHFTVIVFGKDPAKQLQPYHEFECTGQDDKYVQDIDETEKLRKEYETMTTTRYKDAEGNLFVTWADQFYREPTAEELSKHNPMGHGWGGGISWTSKDWGDGKGYRPKIAYIPEGYTKVEVKQSAVMTFAEYCTEYEGKTVLNPGETLDLNEKHKYGYCLIDDKGEVVKVIDRTNPNAKWDWFVVGGRWSGFFKLKEGAEGILGKKGVMGANRNHKPGYADIAKKKDIDFASMEETASKKAAEVYDKVAA
ncbi:hypothetical protein Emin_0980 [Elusimicrobium minutum Pei191]|uniref:Uncharacterized protein n=1 Tax=Elusimicrobium minutum (strain Pei191) TaxID=445932 RepID=B2KDD7_ELUMP|nr:hypothetical protein [Elusimicrobium minutum]ACC98533.1 hypothetical protein Emin_0980 [Elusimicrobium minutum Pei191]